MVIAAMLLVAVMGVVPVVRADDATIVDSGTFKSGGTWSLDSEGVLTLSGNIKCDSASVSSSSWPWNSYRYKIVSVVSNDVKIIGDATYMLDGFRWTDLSEITSWDTSELTSMEYMFAHSNLVDVSAINSWDVSKVRYMSYAFAWNSKLTRLDLSNWDTSSVIYMYDMFSNCSSLESLKGLEKWNTSKVTRMDYMFSSCSSLTNLNLSAWDTSNVTNMTYMFGGCTSLADLSTLAGWDVSSVSSMSSMFYKCSKLTNTSFLTNWSTPKLTATDSMFAFTGLSSLFNADGLDLSNTAAYANLFSESSFIDKTTFSEDSGWTLKDGTLTLFGPINATKLGKYRLLLPRLSDVKNLSVQDVSFTGKMIETFAGLSNLSSIDLSQIDFSDTTEMQSLFKGDASLRSGIFPGGGTWELTDDGILSLSGDIDWSASDADSWPWCESRSAIKKVVITDSTVISRGASYMFADCTNLSTIEGLDKLDMSKASTTSHMFDNCISLTDLTKVKEWSVANVKDMTRMFALCTSASAATNKNEILSAWNIPDGVVTTDMFLGWENESSISINKFTATLDNANSFTKRDDSTYVFDPAADSALEATYSVSFSLSGNTPYETGSIELRIPGSLISTRDGSNPKSTVKFSIPEYPSKSSKIGFNYKYDESTDEYVIKNTETIAAATEVAFTFPYATSNISYIKDGASTNFVAKLSVSNDTGSYYAIAAADSVVCDSHAEYNSVSISASTNAATIKGNILYIPFVIDENMDITQQSTAQIVISSDDSEHTSTYKYIPLTNRSLTYSSERHSVTLAYPLTEELKDGYSHKLSATVVGELFGEDGTYDTYTKTYSFNYRYNTFNPQKRNDVSKYNSIYYNTGGQIEALLNGDTVYFEYKISSTAYNFDLTCDGDESDSSNYGQKNWLFTLNDSDLYFDDDSERPLTSEDYEISLLHHTTDGNYLYEYEETGHGWDYVRALDPLIKVYGKKADGTMKFIKDWDARESIDLSGKGYVGIYLECSSTLGALYLNDLNIRVTLKPSDYILSKLNDSSADAHYVTNTVTTNVYDSDGNCEAEKTASGKHQMTTLSVTTGGQFYSYPSTSSYDQCFNVQYNLSMWDSYPKDNPDAWKKMEANGEIKFQNSGTFYVLLPQGMTVDTSKIKFYNKGTNATVSQTDVIENYKQTNRMLLIIKTSTTDNFSSYYCESGFTLSIPGMYDYAALSDYGGTLKCDYIYKTDNDTWPSTSVKTAEDWIVDISDLTDDTDKKLFYSASNTATVDIGAAADLSLTKAVKTKSGSSYQSGTTSEVVVKDGEAYSYRLRFGSESDTTTSGIILFDSIENYIPEDGAKSKWRGTLESIDLSQPKAKGIAPVVYYSTIENLNIEDHHDVSDNTVWSLLAEDTDFSTITAIAIDMRKATDGSDYQLEEKQTIRVTLNMKAPSGDDYKKAARKKARAYNNVYLLNNLTTSTSFQSDHFIHYDYTEVRLEEPDILPVSVSLSAKKVLEDEGLSGMTLAESEFSFILKDSSGKTLQTKANAADGTVTFDEIEFDEEGTYTYVIEEVLPSGGTYSEDRKKYVKDNITYDLNPVTVSIVVTVNDNNELVATKQ